MGEIGAAGRGGETGGQGGDINEWLRERGMDRTGMTRGIEERGGNLRAPRGSREGQSMGHSDNR